MSKNNNDFFKEKKSWSVVKDELLGCYLKPYVNKILHTHKPLTYVDCFAGKGRFEDGQPGSPLIALEIISDCLGSTTAEHPRIDANFIDLNHASELRKNLKKYPGVNVISGRYEENIKELLSNKKGSNVFLYVDPYGIKALQCALFDEFANEDLNTIELLINMNSFGFIREACHALGTSFNDNEIFDDLVEYETTKLDASAKSIKELNYIAGGDYWQPIIHAYKNGEIDGYEAETRFAEAYCSRLMESYTYVLNMPLRIKEGQRPKYRLIHATNHHDGCLLMVDNICNRWESWQDIQSGGQMKLWEEDCDNKRISANDLKVKVEDHFSKITNEISLHKALAVFFVKNGPICKTGEIRNILKSFEKEGKLIVLRTPEFTKKGTPTTFMTENSRQSVSVRWKQ